MSTRIEIELTSTTPDGSWTWRAAGAREPRGVVGAGILPTDSKVGDHVRVEVEQGLDGIHVVSVVAAKERTARSDLLELLPTESSFEPVIQQRARRERGERRDDRRDRRDRGDRGDRRGGRDDRRDRPDRRDRADRGDRRDRPHHDDRPDRRSRPHFTPPAELPQRPKPKRLRPAKEHRAEILASLPEEQRPVAELTLQGIKAVRQRLRDDNAKLRAEGKPEMPEAAVLKMAEELLPRLRVAEWMDRAVAAKRQLAHLDLRDLRSVVVAADDPLVTRDETTRELAAELKQALVTKQDEEQALWLSDMDAAVEVGRVVRALRLSSQPPKAGVPFPAALATRLGDATTASLQPADPPDRWIAVLEAAAFSPVRAHVAPTAPPEHSNTDLVATVTRLGPLLPQVAAIFGIEVDPNAPAPKPLRMPPRKPDKPRAAKPDRPATGSRPAGRPAAAEGQSAPSESTPAEAESMDAAQRQPGVTAADDQHVEATPPASADPPPETAEPAGDDTASAPEAATPAPDELSDVATESGPDASAIEADSEPTG